MPTSAIHQEVAALRPSYQTGRTPVAKDQVTSMARNSQLAST